jgi:O-antigen/teichoic acid export membrane protein
MLFAGVVVHRVADRQPKNSENSPTPGFDVSSVFRFSWPLIFTTCFYWIQNSGYRFLLVRLTDEASIGLLVTGLAIAVSPLTMFDTLFTEYYRPVFYQDIAYSDSVQKTRAWNHYASAYFPAIVLVATLLAFGGPLLAQLLVSKEFQGVSWLAFWGALIQSALMVYSTYVYLVFASLDTRVMIWPNIAGAAVVVFGILLMAPWKPLLGSGIALSLGMFITTWSLAQILKRKFYLHLPWRRIIFAGLLSLPMAVGLNWFRQIYSEPSLLQAISALAFAGLYMLGSQFILAREWLFQRKNQTSPRPNAVSLQKKDVKL